PGQEEVDRDGRPQGEQVERRTVGEEAPRHPRSALHAGRGGADLERVGAHRIRVGELRFDGGHRTPPVVGAKNFSGSGDAALSSRVYGFCALRMTSSAGPCSTMRPWLSTMISSLKCRAVARSWVM